MKVFIPPTSDNPEEYDSLEDLINAFRLSEVELFDELLEPAEVDGLLNGIVPRNILRTVIWVILRRSHPELEKDGFDVEFDDVDEDTDTGKE